MSNHLMGFGSFGLTMGQAPTPTAMMLMTGAVSPAMAVQPTFMQVAGPSPYITQQVENLRGALIKFRSSDPLKLCQSQAFNDTFHPKGFAFGCASVQVRLNGSPFRQALRNTLETMKVKWSLYGGEDPKSVAAPLAVMIAQESDMSAGDAASHIGADMQQVMGVTSFRLATAILPIMGGGAVATIPGQVTGVVIGGGPVAMPGLTINGGVIPSPGGPSGDEGFYAPSGDEGFYAPTEEDLAVEVDTYVEAEERAEEDAEDTKKYLLWGLVAGGVLIGGYLLFGRKS